MTVRASDQRRGIRSCNASWTRLFEVVDHRADLSARLLHLNVSIAATAVENGTGAIQLFKIHWLAAVDAVDGVGGFWHLRQSSWLMWGRSRQCAFHRQ